MFLNTTCVAGADCTLLILVKERTKEIGIRKGYYSENKEDAYVMKKALCL